ncbi:MAG: signal peptidase I [Pirellulales bacterium]
MSKTKKPPKIQSIPKLASQPTEAAPQHAPWFRETVESIVIAFVLAFLFRTFEAEAFVIPTGSMAPTLMGRHKDVYCPQCGHRFQVTASEEESDEALAARAQRGQQAAANYECVAGVCPMCRYTMPMRANLPNEWLANYSADDIKNHKSYNGDRILVNKYVYTLDDPERWDIVVFHFPGDAQMNYIKRLVGLPGETLRIFQGDLFVKRDGAGASDEFQIEHKPADKLLAMRQLVHDTDYDPSVLYAAGWPLRWSEADASGGWQATADASGKSVQQRFTIDSTNDETFWIRYRNFMPDNYVWQELAVAQRRAREQGGPVAKLTDENGDRARPQLVMDFNAYNTRVTLGQAMQTGSLAPQAIRMGIHWVGDLMVVADVDVEAARGELVLDLVEGGKHFTCTIDLATGQAKLSADGAADYAPTAKTILNAPGKYRVGLANFDDQLTLFVKERSMLLPEFRAGDAVAFEGGTAYDADLVFGERRRILPQTSADNPGDLAPAGVGARGAKLSVNRLQVWRDIYYIADSWQQHQSYLPITDMENLSEQMIMEMPFNPSQWPNLLNRRSVEFALGADQFFVMGDNSPESSDARLWRDEHGRGGGRPGGDYLERRLLIGKALCVYWPHSWNRIPGTPIPFPLFPNFEDMRLVR